MSLWYALEGDYGFLTPLLPFPGDNVMVCSSISSTYSLLACCRSEVLGLMGLPSGESTFALRR